MDLLALAPKAAADFADVARRTFDSTVGESRSDLRVGPARTKLPLQLENLELESSELVEALLCGVAPDLLPAWQSEEQSECLGVLPGGRLVDLPLGDHGEQVFGVAARPFRCLGPLEESTRLLR